MSFELSNNRMVMVDEDISSLYWEIYSVQWSLAAPHCAKLGEL